jgi:hypothetical protein
LIQKPNWSVLLEGERFALNLQVQNTGIVLWTPHSTQFSLETSVLVGRNQLPIAQEIKPGGIVTITQTLAGFSEKGVHLVQISWGIVHQGRFYRGEPFEFNVVILPPIDEEKRIELEEKIEEWRIEHPGEVEQLVQKWLRFPETPSPASLEGEAVQDKIHLDNAVIIPLLMLPVLIILAALIGRMRG